MSIAGLLNNTILIPTGGNLASLPTNKVANDLSNVDYESIDYRIENPQTVYIKVKDQQSVKLISVQSIDGLEMKRENSQQRAGGSPDYVVNLPGNVSYSEVTLTHVFTRDTYFLDWLKNGCLNNGVARADIEIYINAFDLDKKQIVLTLYDAFPTKWEIRQMGFPNLMSRPVATEWITFCFSKIYFALQQAAVN